MKIWLMLIVFSLHAHGNEQTLRVAVFSDQLSNIQKDLDSNGCTQLNPDSYQNNQMVMEYQLLCQSLIELLPDIKLKLVGYPVALRAVNAVAEGEADLTGFGVWSGESNKVGIIRTMPLLEFGEFNKGLFVTPKTLQTLNIATRKTQAVDFDKMIAVSNRNWSYDWGMLKCGMGDVLHVDHYEQMFHMLQRERADVLPLAFGKEFGVGRREFGVELVPIPGYKLVIPDSSHYLISSKLSFGFSLAKTLNNRLVEMREDGSLLKHYESVGAVSPAAKDWKPICDVIREQ